jgi:hypothetical protein
MLDAVQAILSCQKLERLAVVQGLYKAMDDQPHHEVVDIVSYTLLQVSLLDNPSVNKQRGKRCPRSTRVDSARRENLVTTKVTKPALAELQSFNDSWGDLL